jgi:hypothetical protein
MFSLTPKSVIIRTYLILVPYPTIIDLSARDGYKRLSEIQEAVEKGEFKDWLELVFLPLYGNETGYQRSKFVEKIL